MLNHSRSLLQLCTCLRGGIPADVDWMSLLGLANQTLTTPALHDFATRFKAEIPEDVSRYIREMFERNVARNKRLSTQLAETVKAVNDGGVTPVLLKGAAMLATTAQSRWGSRLMSDLDIMVLPDEVEPAMSALFVAGYTVHTEAPPNVGKWYVDLKRPDDVGMLDLHRELPGPAFFYESPETVRQHCRRVAVGSGIAYVPSPTFQAFILTVHDQFQDYDYWIGNIDVRHLMELRDLAASPEGIDWEKLAALAPSRLARNALETQLVALFCLLGVDVPPHMRNRFVPRLQHRRRLAQARLPLLRQALLPITVFDYRNYRRGLGLSTREGRTSGRQKWQLPKTDTLRFLLELSRSQRAGKI